MTTDDNERWDDFWGDEPDWPTASIPVARKGAPAPDSGESGSDDTGSGGSGSGGTPSSGLFRRRSGVAGTGQIPITRQHRRIEAGPDGLHSSPDVPAAEPSRLSHTSPDGADPIDAGPEPAAGPVWDQQWVPVARSGWRDIDPRLFRLGALAVLVTLLIPLIVGFSSGGDDDTDLVATAEAEPTTDALVTVTVPTTEALFVEVPSSTSPAPSAPSAAPPATADAAADATPASTESAAEPTTDDTAAAATTDGTEELSTVALAEQLCPADYDVQEGDFWIRLADGAGVELGELLDVNDATIDTPLYPGRTICLPAGARTPPPPPATTVAPQPSSGAGSGGGSNGNTSTPSTAAPRPTPTSPPTTAAPPTTEAPPRTAPPPAEIERIIRSVWPDDLEDRALEIAWRESGYRANVRNYCCFGLFQIYWSVHQSWLSAMGITSSAQLYDAETNARAALALYERSGGWGPWGG